MRVSQAGTDLFQVKQCFFQGERSFSATRSEITPRHVFQNNVMKRHIVEVNRRPMPKPADDIRMPNSVECYGLVLEVRHKRSFQIRVRLSLQVNVQRLNDHCVGLTLLRSPILCHVYFGIATAAEAFDDVKTPIEAGLLKLEI